MKTGTATSYANALKYLFDYLGFKDINEQTILTIKSIELDIRDTHAVLYNNILRDFTSQGKVSYIQKGFVKAAISALYEFLNTTPISLDKAKDNILIDAIFDNKIVATFNPEKLKRELPFAKPITHSYDVRRINGTTKDAAKKICNGRKAEKYFISYLETCLGLKSGTDFIDVSNNKEFGYDIKVLDYAMEVKNIKNGGFYVTDNEIARLENTETHLIFVDIDNGIWLLKNNSIWLKNIIDNIKAIRSFCDEHYSQLDLTDIRINLDQTVETDIVEITNITLSEFKNILANF